MGPPDASQALDRYRLALEIAPLPMLLVAPSGRIALSNADADRLFGFVPEGLVGHPVDQLLPETLREAHVRMRAEYFVRPEKRAMGAGRELQGVTRDGEALPLELALEPVTLGAETWALVVAIDIRPRKRLEEQARTRLDAADCAMLGTGPEGRILFANHAAGTLFGYPCSELVGMPVNRLLARSIRSDFAAQRACAIRDGQRRRLGVDGITRARHRDGHTFPAQIGMTPVDTITGTEFVLTVVDLTERQAVEQAVAAQTAELQSLNRDLAQFAYAASHDLKAPLATLAGLLHFAREDLTADDLDDAAENLDIALEVTDRAVQRVEAVLQIARDGEQRPPPRNVPLAPMLDEIWQDMSAALDVPAVLLTDLDHRGPLWLDVTALRTVLENLFSNAVRYRDPEKPCLELRVTSHEAPGAGLGLTVTDNGIGIAPDQMPRLFDMFYRGDARSGDGLGLALVRKEIQRLGGEITVESTPGEGSCFTLTLPAAPPGL